MNWLGATDLLADDLIQSQANQADKEGALEDAMYFLRITLHEGTATWEELLGRAREEEGLSERTLRRARVKLKLKKQRLDQHQVVWDLPPGERLKAIDQRACEPISSFA